jgi:hypothetical protein
MPLNYFLSVKDVEVGVNLDTDAMDSMVHSYQLGVVEQK